MSEAGSEARTASRDWRAVALPLADRLGPESVVLDGPEAAALAEALRGIGVLADLVEAQPPGARHDLAILLAPADAAETPQAAAAALALSEQSDLLLLIPLGFAQGGEAHLQLLAWFTVLAELGYQPVVEAALDFVGRGAFLVDRAATAGEAELAAFAERLTREPDAPTSARIEALEAQIDEAAPLREAVAASQAAREAAEAHSAGLAERLARAEARALDAERALIDARQQAERHRAALEQALRWDVLRVWVRQAVANLPQPRRHPFSLAVFRRRREAEPLALLRAAPLFDAAWYIACHPELAIRGGDPARHYLTIGAADGDDPGPFFDSAAYRLAHPRLGREPPLLHALRTGEVDTILHAVREQYGDEFNL